MNLSTGIKRLDDALMEGIPGGFTMLVEGNPGAGMELFAKQFSGGVSKNEKVVYFSTNESEEEVKEIMAYYKRSTTNLKVISIESKYYEQVLSLDLKAARLKYEGLQKKDILELKTEYEKPEEKLDLLENMLYEIVKLKKNYRIVIDSLDFFFEQYDAKKVLHTLRAIDAHLKYTKGVGVFTFTKGLCDRTTEIGVYACMDVIIELEVERVGTGFEYRLIIRKVKNLPQKSTIMIYSISEEGITPELVTRIR